MSPPTPPAHSSTGSPGRCSCTRSATGGSVPTTTVVEASSGSTAVSEAYFARLIGVPFVAVMSRATSPAKIALIEREGGRCHLIDDPAAVSDVAARAGARAGWALPRPVHLRRACHGLARQQQHRRIDPRPDGPGTAQHAVMDRRRRRNRRYRGHIRQVPAAARHHHQVVRRGPGGLSLPPVVPGTGGGRHRVAHRGHRPAAGGAVLRAGRRRPDAGSPRRRLGRDDAVPEPPPGDLRRSLNRHQRLRCPAARLRDVRGSGQPARSSRSCATAAPGIPPHTTTTPGSRNRESTSALTCPWSNEPGTRESGIRRRRLLPVRPARRRRSWCPGGARG